MALEQENRAALRILVAIEEGAVAPDAAFQLVDEADPALIYLIFTWLRKKYSGDHPAAEGVLGRMLAISKRGSVPEKMKEGQADPVVEWFEDTYSYKDLEAAEFIELIVDKLES